MEYCGDLFYFEWDDTLQDGKSRGIRTEDGEDGTFRGFKTQEECAMSFDLYSWRWVDMLVFETAIFITIVPAITTLFAIYSGKVQFQAEAFVVDGRRPVILGHVAVV